jgi:hypothetical protein
MNIAWSLKLWLIITLESTHLWRALFNVLNQALHKILRKVHGGRINTGVLKENLISCDHLLEQVKKIKEELTKEAQWRPVFADMFPFVKLSSLAGKLDSSAICSSSRASPMQALRKHSR